MAYTPIANSPAEDVRLPSAIAPGLSLLSVASPLPPLDTNVATARDGLPASPGFKLDRTGCVTTEGIPNCPSTEKAASMTSGATYPFAPFWIDSSYECDFSPTPGDRLYEIARTNLEAGTAWSVSRQLQTGALNVGTTSQSPSLNSTATTVDDSGEDLDIALGVLLNAWYTTVSQAGPAVLHLPVEFVPFALRHSIIHTTAGGTALEVLPGLSVSTGPGYDVTSKPAGTPTLTAHTAYVYLTGPVYVGLGNIENAANPAQLPLSVDRLEGAHEVRQNKTLVVARRRAVALFDTCSVLAIAANAPFLT